MPSYTKPTNDLVEKTLPQLSSSQQESYFFSRLDNPLWIEPLNEHEYFKYPPAAIPQPDGSIRYPQWAPSRYLSRMATQEPELVISIYESLETDNASIIGDMLEAALNAPIDVGVRLASNVLNAAKKNHLWVFYKEATEFCAKLADEKYTAEAIKLADALFHPRFGRDTRVSRSLDEYQYKEGLSKVAPSLVQSVPERFLKKICHWLRRIVEHSKHVVTESGDDMSVMWRPAIEEHHENRDYEFAGVIAGIVREAFEVSIHQTEYSLANSLELLGQFDLLIFQRLGIHLIGEFSQDNQAIARDTILNRELFDSYKFKHEYAMLLGKCFGILTDDEQGQWYEWIDDGPDMADFEQSIMDNMDREATEEDRKERIDYWRYEKLHWIREYLQGEYLEFYTQMLEEHGEPEMADLNFRINSNWEDPESPISVEELQSLSFEQAVGLVSKWEPKSHREEFYSDRLTSAFSEYLKTAPTEFSKRAQLLIGKPVDFVIQFIRDMENAVKQNLPIELSEVLALCDWLLDESKNRISERGGHWQWARDSVSGLLEEVCKVGAENTYHYSVHEFRERIWRLIESLNQDRFESNFVHDISEDDLRNKDYFQHGMNSSRGRAVLAMLSYASWVGNTMNGIVDGRDCVPDGFNAMPEVRNQLEWHIDTENRNVEVLSVIGTRIPTIYWIDREWLNQHASQIFNLEEWELSPKKAYGWAAWNSFLTWVKPHKEYLRLFRSQYEFAVDQSSDVELTDDTWGQPMMSLGKHLVVYYGRGHIELEEGELLYRFLENAKSEIRRQTIGFAGQSLCIDIEISPETVNRFIEFWTFYWQSKGKADAEESPGSMTFGRWFLSDSLPIDWRINHLLEFVDCDPLIEPDHQVFETLANAAESDPPKAVTILDTAIRGDTEGWRIRTWLEHAESILRTALNSGNEAEKKARELVNILGRRGFLQFGKLLEQK
ncbi:MAG: hypothetical protein HUJ26_18220 [Planctomycetaceae bacterium]|nr:hypothetical protein [Planctomycetaceae bacterium]